MNQASTDWTSAIVIAVAGLLLGVLFFFFNKRKAAPSLDKDLERKDLEAKRDALIAQLRALPDDAVDERARLEGETAVVLRSLDHYQTTAPYAAGSASTAMNPTIKGFLWGSGSTAALAILLFYVYQTATPRPQGEMATGGIGTQPQQQQPQQAAAADPMVQQMEAAVQRDPNNNALRLDLAEAYLQRDNMMGVFEQTKVVLEREPKNARALTFSALVRMAMGETDQAVAQLQEATTVEPKNLDAWVAMAWIHAQTGRMKDAESAIAQASLVSPENKGRLEDVLAQMKAHIAQQQNAQQAAAVPQGQMPADHPPIGGAPAGGAPADGARVQVTLQLDPAARAKSGVVFVVARPLSGGPPVAVKRMQVATFPVTFELTSADSMMGQPLPEKFRLEARLDSDGNATTKPPTDPSAAQPEVVSGAAITLALK